MLNPIERLWSVLKRKWTQGLYHFSDELAQLQKKKVSVPRQSMINLQALLGKILFYGNAFIKDSIDTQTVKRLASSHYKGMLSVLQGQLV